ncbi:MAG: restriction endonuclease, partial [Chloroflexota bacterium]|nr:restriction endonuclease [Chloroflexota bacterium]
SVALQNLDKLVYVAIAIALAVGAGWYLTRRVHLRWLEQHTDLATIVLMSPRRFEIFCRDLMEREGYRAHVTRFSQDQGVDIVLRDRRGRGLAQVKRWASVPVGRPHLQQLYGEMSHRRAAFGYFITTSWFTREAIQWTRGKAITLVDGRRLESLASKHFGRIQVSTDDMLAAPPILSPVQRDAGGAQASADGAPTVAVTSPLSAADIHDERRRQLSLVAGLGVLLLGSFLLVHGRAEVPGATTRVAAARPAITPAPTLSLAPSTSADIAAGIVSRFYAAIQQHDFATAYALFGADWQRSQSYEDFVAGFAQTLSTSFSTESVRASADGATVNGHVIALELLGTEPTGYVTRSVYAGSYDVGLVNGQWRIISGALALSSRSLVAR